MDDGKGLVRIYPPVSDSDYIANDPHSLIEIIKYGIEDPIIVNGIPYRTPMEGFERLNDVQLSNLYNYILDEWYPDVTPLNFTDVQTRLENKKR